MRRKECRFEQHIGSVIGNTGMLTAHHTADGDRLFVIGDQQGIRRQLHFTTIKQRQLLTLVGHAHTYAALDFPQVKGVHRMTKFEQHKVGDIDRQADAFDTATTQFLDHPQRCFRFRIDAFDNPAAVTWAGFRCQQFNRQLVR